MYNGVHSNDDIDSQYIQHDGNFNVSHDFHGVVQPSGRLIRHGHPTIASNQTWHGKSPSKMEGHPGYPLVICYIAIENGHRNSGFSH